jgi:hypothetical protein
MIKNLFNNIILQQIPNYAQMSFLYFNGIRTDISNTLSKTEICPDQNNPDLIKLLSDAKLIK